MKPAFEHPWDFGRAEAEHLQQSLRQRVVATNQTADVHTVAGFDLAFAGDLAHVAAVVLSYPALETLEVRTATCPVTFPYIPGLLSFREIPAIIAVAAQLRYDPDLLIGDGQGIAHPRRFGFSSHLGVLFDKPAIGCAKSRLVGRHEPVGPNPGDASDLADKDDVIGCVLRTKANSKPLYISTGHKVDLPTAISFILRCCRGYRVPEPTRLAHLAAGGRLPQTV